MLLRKDGSSFPGEINAKVILFNKAPQIQVWIRDLTEQKRLEKKLVHAQKMEAIGTLTGGIAHDFNNLLTIINGFTEMILLETPEDDPRYADLQKILKAGGKGAEMIQRLLTFNQNGGSSPQLVEVNRTVQNSIKLAATAFPRPIAIETALGKHLSIVNADAAQIEQVLVNLFVNAAEATADGGKLKIETRNVRVGDDDGEHHVSVTPGTYVLITVADTGCGMDSETLDRIFDPFFTTKGWDFRKGTGLGLSVAKGIVELHGGRITCKSQLGEGTTFSVYLPVVPESAGRGRPETSVSRVPGTGTVLLVDDEELVLELGKRILERAGYPVITAVNGREALDIYKRERSSIGLVVLDLLMPEMDGEQCLEELLKIDPEAIVLVSSGHSLSPQEQDCLAAHAKGFVNKPYQVDQLIQAVRGFV